MVYGVSGLHLGKFVAKTFGGGSLMGVGYTSGAYTGYGISNTADPIGIHNQAKSYNKPQYIQIEQNMSYGSYGRRSYGRYSRYRGYRRRSYYRRRPRYYRRSYY